MLTGSIHTHLCHQVFTADPTSARTHRGGAIHPGTCWGSTWVPLSQPENTASPQRFSHTLNPPNRLVQSPAGQLSLPHPVRLPFRFQELQEGKPSWWGANGDPGFSDLIRANGNSGPPFPGYAGEMRKESTTTQKPMQFLFWVAVL